MLKFFLGFHLGSHMSSAVPTFVYLVVTVMLEFIRLAVLWDFTVSVRYPQSNLCCFHNYNFLFFTSLESFAHSPSFFL